LLWLERGKLTVEDGTLHFLAAKSDALKAGDYSIPFQTVSFILIGPGTTVSHDVFRLLARHGTGLVAVGEGGVRLYSAPPIGSNASARARQQARLWADAKGGRMDVARQMYAWRLGKHLPQGEIAVLRGIEGSRMKESYRLSAQRFGLTWRGRRYDRARPDRNDDPNQAINHAATAVEAAATIAIAATGTIAQLGFIHEASANAFCLDIADLFRDEVTIPVAFEGVKLFQERPQIDLERHVRKLACRRFKEKKLIPAMIDRIKELFHANDSRDDS
jgi:CRISPR-associated protein Cas1